MTVVAHAIPRQGRLTVRRSVVLLGSNLAQLCLVVCVGFLEHEAVNEARIGKGYSQVGRESQQRHQSKTNKEGNPLLRLC